MPRPKKSDFAGNMSAAAVQAGISVETVQKAKALGCEAFTNTRIDVPLLKKWVAEHEDELKATPAEGSTLSLKEQKLNEEIRKLRIRNDRDDRLVVLRSKVIGAHEATVAAMRKIISQKLENEYPSAVAGQDIPTCRVYGRKIGDELIKEFQGLSEHWRI